MRLDNINALIDAKRVYDRAYRRVIDEDPNTYSFYFKSVDEFRQAATVTDSCIKRYPLNDEGEAILKFSYRGAEFCCVSNSGEVV